MPQLQAITVWAARCASSQGRCTGHSSQQHPCAGGACQAGQAIPKRPGMLERAAWRPSAHLLSLGQRLGLAVAVVLQVDHAPAGWRSCSWLLRPGRLGLLQQRIWVGELRWPEHMRSHWGKGSCWLKDSEQPCYMGAAHTALDDHLTR